MKTVKSLSLRTIIMMASTILLNAISIITAPIFTRILTTSDYGVFSLFTSWVGIFAIIFGGQTYGALNNAKVEYTEDEYPGFCFNAFLISVFGCLLAGIITFVFYGYISIWVELPSECVIWLLISSFGTYSVNFLSSYFIIEKKVIQNFLVSLVVTLSTTVLSIVLILYASFEGYYSRILGYSGVYLVASICIVFYFCRFAKKGIKREYWKFCLNLSLPLVVHGLSAILLAQSDRIMLMADKGEAVVGVYSFCYTIALPISVVAKAINSAWTPEYYALKAEGKEEEIQRHYNRQLVFMTCITCGYMMVAPEVLKILSTESYWSGIRIIPLVIIGYYFNFLYYYPTNHEFYNKKTKYIAISTMGAALINIILNYGLIPGYGMQGAAMATIIAYVCLFALHDFIAKKIVKGYEIARGFYAKGIIIVACCYFISQLINEAVGLRWGVGIIIGIILLLNIKKQKAII